MNTCSITVRDVRNAVLGRAMALRMFVAGHDRLYEEYRESVLEKGVTAASTGWIDMELDAWIASKGFKILNEHAFVTYKDGVYYVDVMYTIEMTE